MVIMPGNNKEESVKTKMKNYLKRVVTRPSTERKKHTRKKKSEYLGEKERAELTRTFSPPPAPLTRSSRPEALVLHHQSEEALHYIDYNTTSCDIGSAGSSHSSGFNESMFDMVLEGKGGFKAFDVDSPITSECNLAMRDEEALKPLSSVFEGIGGVDITDGLDAQKDQSQIVQALTYKNKILTSERNELQHQLEQQEEQYDRMEEELKRVKRERRTLEKSKKEEGSRLRGENKELDHTLEVLRQQKLETENKLELLERERESVRVQIEELRFQLSQAHEDLTDQKQRLQDMAKSLETKDKQLRELADSYRLDTDLSTASQLRIDELEGENRELRSHLQRFKMDKSDMAGRLTRLTCELSRMRQGIPTSPMSPDSSVTSPIVAYHSLAPVFEESPEGDTLHDLLAKRRIESPSKEIDRLSDSSYSAIIEERNALIQKNCMLEDRLEDMQKLMYVVAPQHYIDDEALQLNPPSRVQYNTGEPTEIQYQYIRTSCVPTTTEQMRLTPTEEDEISALDEDSAATSTVRQPSRSRETTDDADSGVLSQSSTDITLDEEAGCEGCSLWRPEKDLLVEKVLRSELSLQSIRRERDAVQQELSDLQAPRWRGWLVHVLALLILFLITSTFLPFFYNSQPCRQNHLSWADLLSLRLVHPRERTYQITH